MIMTILFLIVYGYIILSSGRNLFFFFVRYGALRSPLPGIPFNIAAYRRAFGDIAELNERRRNGETSIRPWFLEQAARHKSAIVQIFLGPFARPAVLLSDYREVYDILTHRDADFKRGKKVDVFKGVLPHAFVSMESFDPRFNETRNLMNDLMAPSFLHKVSAPWIYRAACRLVELWRLKSVLARERPFDVAEDIIDFSFDAILSAAIGLKDTGGDIDRQLSHLQAFDHSKLVSTDNVSPYEPISFPKPRKSPELLALRVIEQSLWKGFYMPWPRLYHFVNNLRPSVQNANRTLKTYIRTQTRNAASRLEEGEEPQSALDYIIQREVRAAEKANREPHLEDPRVRDGVYGYLIAGHDTSSGSLTWLIRRLVAHPEEQAKIRASLRETYSVAWAEKRFPSAAELVQTAPYLDAFVEEVLRFNCPAVTIAVSTRRDTSILGHAVPRDTAVFLNLTGPSLNMPSIAVDETLRSPTSQARRDMRPTWDDAEPTAFQPERWLSTDHTGKVTFNPRSGPTLSFSAGERGCWGKRLGYLELKVLLSLLVWAFSFGTVPEELGSWETCDSLVTGPKHCFVQLSQL